MTWPFENDTGAIVKKLAKRSVTADRQRLLFASVTVTIAVALIMTLTTVLFSTYHAMSYQAGKMPQAFLYGINADVYDGLKAEESIDKIINLYMFEPMEYTTNVSLLPLFSDTPSSLPNAVLMGNIPQMINEIVLTSGSLAYLPEHTGIGSSLTLDLGDGMRTYTVSGLMELPSERTDTITVYCSKDYLYEAKTANEISYTIYLFFKEYKDMTQEEVTAQLDYFSEKYNIPSDNTSVSSLYFSLVNREITATEVLQFLFIVLIAFFAAAIVIYNIFYISISRKTQEYGQLRTIGMTSKQVMKMLSAEGRKITIPSVLTGIAAGGVIGYVIRTEGWYWLGAVISALIAFVFGVLTVTISIHSPAKKASRISPMEALDYSGYSGEKITQRKQHKITPFTLALRNLLRNKKKTTLAILSLGLCGVMFIACASMQNSISETNMARAQEFQYGNFKLEFEGDRSALDRLGGEAQNFSRGALQANSDIFSSGLKQAVLSIDGVDSIKEWYATTALFTLEGQSVSGEQTTVWGYTQDSLSKMKDSLVEGTMETDKTIQNGGLVVNISENLTQEVYNWTPKIGDQVTFAFWSNSGTSIHKTFTVTGITDGRDGYDAIFRLPLEQLQALAGYDVTSDWEIITAPGKDAEIEAELRNLVEKSPELSLKTFQDYINKISEEYQTGIFLVYILVLFIAAVGMINLINLTITNQIIRKRESGIMLAVGLTRRQLRLSRLYEGELLVIGSILIASVIGIPLGYAVTNTFKVIGAVERYLFPFQEYILFLSALLLLQFVLEVLLNRSSGKETLVDLTRGN